MAFEVLFTDHFGEWWDTITEDQQDAIAARVGLLAEHGPALGRPTVDTLTGARHQNMKELRVGPLRILFAFDPKQQAILLLGGDKSRRWTEWYRQAIPLADDLYDAFLSETNQKED